jgi:hypothetical protein
VYLGMIGWIALSIYSGCMFGLCNFMFGKLSDKGPLGIVYMWSGLLPTSIIYFVYRGLKTKKKKGKCYGDLYTFTSTGFKWKVPTTIISLGLFSMAMEAGILWNF